MPSSRLCRRRTPAEDPAPGQLPRQPGRTGFVLQGPVKRIEEEVVASGPVYAEGTGYPWEDREERASRGVM